MHKRLVLLLFALLPWLLAAQSDAPLRIELPAAKDRNDYHFANMGEKGALVFYEANRHGSDSAAWAFIHYDTLLQKDCHFSLNLPNYTEYISHSETDSYLYIFFQKRYSKKEPVTNFLLTIQLADYSYNLRKIAELKNRHTVAIQAIDNQIVFHAADTKRDSLYFYHCATGQLLSLGDIFPYTVEFCTADTANRRWLVGLKAAKGDNPGEIFIYDYDYERRMGRVRSFLKDTPGKGGHLYNSARAVVVNADTTLIFGTFNTLQDRNSHHLHSGVYSRLLRGWDLDSAKFYNFANLKTKQTDNEGDSSTKGSDKKGRDSNLNLQLVVGRTASDGRQFALATEIYRPEYDYNTPGYEPYGVGIGIGGIGQGTFIGYKYVNAYITAFDRAGDLLWDNLFPFRNILTRQLQRYLRLHFWEDGSLLICHPLNNRIVSMLVDGQEVLEKADEINLETSSKRDLVEYNSATGIEHWYGDYFLAYGYQYIRNRDKTVKAKRYVFFINKLEYE